MLSDKHLRSEWARFKRGEGWEPTRSAVRWLAEYKAELERFRELSDEDFARPEEQAKLWSATMVGSAGAGERVDTDPLHRDPQTVELLNELRTLTWPNARRRSQALRERYKRVRGRMNALAFSSNRHPLAKLRRIFALLAPADATCIFSKDRNSALARVLVPSARRGSYIEHCARARGRLREVLGPEATLDEEIERALFLHWLQRQLSARSSARRREPSSWLSRVQLLDDAPITRVDAQQDLLGFADQVEMIAATLVRAKGPMVIHVDGPWGRGKSSFCRMLDERLSSIVRELEGQTVEGVSSSWFIASDRRADVTDGVLHAVACAVTDDDPEETLRILRTWGHDPDAGAGLAAGELVARMSQLRTWVEHELGWRQERGEVEAVTIELAGARLQLRRREVDRRLAVIFVDDLDRCTPENARAVMDAIQQFVGFRGLAFVIAADRAVLDVAFAASVRDYVGVERLGPSQALEKYIRHRVQLPGISTLARSPALNHRLVELQAQLMPDGPNLLVGPGAWLAQGVAVLLARSFPATMTMRRLKRILNELATTLAMAADSSMLPVEQLTSEANKQETPLWRYKAGGPKARPRFDVLPPRSTAEFKDFFLGQLAVVTARHVWPSLYALYTRDTARFANVISALTAAGEGVQRWPESMLRDVIEHVIAAEASDQTPFESKKEMCVFLYHGLRDSEPPRGVRAVKVDMGMAAEDLGAGTPQKKRADAIEQTMASAEEDDDEGDEPEDDASEELADDAAPQDVTLESFRVERPQRRRSAPTQARGLPEEADAPLTFSDAEAETEAPDSSADSIRDASAAAPAPAAPAMSSAPTLRSLSAPAPKLRGGGGGMSAGPGPARGPSKSARAAPSRSLEAPSIKRSRDSAKSRSLPSERGLEGAGQPVDVYGTFELRLARLEEQKERLSPEQVRELLEHLLRILQLKSSKSRAWVVRIVDVVSSIVERSRWTEALDESSLLMAQVDERAASLNLERTFFAQRLFEVRERWPVGSLARFKRIYPFFSWSLWTRRISIAAFSKRADELEAAVESEASEWPPPWRRKLLDLFSAAFLVAKPHDSPGWLGPPLLRELENSAHIVSDSPTPKECWSLLMAHSWLPHRKLPAVYFESILALSGSEELDLRHARQIASALSRSEERDHKRRALELFESLESTPQWVPTVLHATAQIRTSLEEGSTRTGRLWELAYRAGLRDPAMQRAFSLFLDEHHMKDIAVRVLRGEDLPPESEWQPFGDTPTLADVVIKQPEPEEPG